MTACNPVTSVSEGHAASVFRVEMLQTGMWVGRVGGSGDGREEDSIRNCQRGANIKLLRVMAFENKETAEDNVWTRERKSIIRLEKIA
jgi:hypothetical protein